MGQPNWSMSFTRGALGRDSDVRSMRCAILPRCPPWRWSDRHILSQVAGHGLNVVKGLPPLTLTADDVDEFAAALDAVLAKAERIPRAAARFALKLGVSSLARR